MFSILLYQTTGEIQTEYTGDDLVPALDAWCDCINQTDEYTEFDEKLTLVFNDTVYGEFWIPEVHKQN